MIAGLALVLGACSRDRDPSSSSSSSSSPSPSPSPSPNVNEQTAGSAAACGRVVFVEDERLRVMPAAGGEATAVTPAAIWADAWEYPAALSPDGRTLVALAGRETPDHKSSDRLALIELASLPAAPQVLSLELGEPMLRSVDWAPDGRWLVLESDAHGFRDLYRIELESRSVLRLTDDPEGNFEPAIAPDGRRIAFVSSRDGNAEIYVMTADGGDPRRLTRSAGDDGSPRWSPDARTLAFTSMRERERGIDVYLMGADGERPRPLVPARARAIVASELAWSPDGERLAFTEADARAGSTVVVIAGASGDADAAAVRIGGEGRACTSPSWSPDGRALVLVCVGDGSDGGRSAIIRVEADGSGQTELAGGEGERLVPRWIADPECERVTVPIASPAQSAVG